MNRCNLSFRVCRKNRLKFGEVTKIWLNVRVPRNVGQFWWSLRVPKKSTKILWSLRVPKKWQKFGEVFGCQKNWLKLGEVFGCRNAFIVDKSLNNCPSEWHSDWEPMSAFRQQKKKKKVAEESNSDTPFLKNLKNLIIQVLEKGEY